MARDPHTEFNPYAPPSAAAELYDAGDSDQQILAGRSTRLGAAMLDNLLLAGVMLPAMLFYAASPGLGALTMGALSAVGLLCYQWYLVSTLGQSLGKSWLGIRIVKMNGAPVNFVSGVILRSWIVQAMAFIPIIGPFTGLLNALMIFGEERRCLHDHLAGTKVITVLPR